MKRKFRFKSFWESFLFMFPILVITWDRSGRGLPERWLFLGFAGYYLIYMVWHAWHYAGIKSWVMKLVSDPILYIGTAFCVLLGIQLWNSGRELVFNRELWEWEYGPPPHLGWPSAITAVEAQQWLFVALMFVSVVCALRCLRFTVHQYRVMCRILLANAILLFFLGLAQYISGTSKQYWFHYLPGWFFSVFGYPNHAASYFVFMFAVSSGFFIEIIQRCVENRRWAIGRVLLYGTSLMCCAFGAVLSLSRAGILLIGVELLLFVGYLCMMLMCRLPVSGRINMILVLGIVLILFFVGLQALGHGKIKNELGSAYKQLSITRLKDPPPRSLTGIRYPFWIAAYGIWKDYPWFGCGSWGYRYLKKMYIPRDRWITKKGYANVHFDGLQFLAEYGVIGLGLLLLSTALLFWGAFGWLFWRESLYLFVFIGLMAVLIHSLIDLPFRCPAVSGHWLCMLTIMGCLKRLTGKGLER